MRGEASSLAKRASSGLTCAARRDTENLLLLGSNPYKAAAGRETDELIHQQFFSNGAALLPYSTDDSAAEKVRARLKAVYKHAVHVGQTRTRPPKFFARFDSGPSTSTEVLAETRALAICRLALLIGSRRDP
jgi:hypothetical protein